MTDPAARLIAILEKGRHADQNQDWVAFWATAFGIPRENTLDLYRGLDLTRKLIDDVKAAINQVPDIRHEQYLRALNPIQEILRRPNLHEAWAHSHGEIPMIINGLGLASERLQAHSPEPEIEAAELQTLEQQVTELITTLEQSTTVPKSLKIALFDLLQSVQGCIGEYRFRGIRGVRRQLFVTASQIQENFPEFEKAKKEPEVKGFFTLLKKIDSITAAALHVKELSWLLFGG